MNRDLVQGEHDGEPYMVSFGDAEVTYDFRSDYRRVVTKGASGSVTRELTVGNADEFASIQGTSTSTTSASTPVRHATLASPAWEARDPFHALLLADKASDLKREPDTTLHFIRQHVVSYSIRGVQVQVFIDAQSNLITSTQIHPIFSHATSAEIAQNAFGDFIERTEFQIWEDTAGLRYPVQWDTYQNGTLAQTLHLYDAPSLSSTWSESDRIAPVSLQIVSELAATSLDRIQIGHPVFNAPDPHRVTEEIAPGIVQIPGSWFTTLVRQDDGIVIIDAPISAGYSAQVISEANRRFPSIPIKAVITSTAFFWHVAGIREYAAHHIAIYVRDANAATLMRILRAPRHDSPDRLAQHPATPILRVVSKRTLIGQGTNRIIVMPIAEATEPMLMTYLPGPRILHTGEMIQPLGPSGAFLYPEALLEIRNAVRAEGLQVERLIGMHMSPRPWSDLDAAITAADAN